MRILIEDGLALERRGGIGRYTRFLLENLPRVGIEPILPFRSSWRGGRILRRLQHLLWLNISLSSESKKRNVSLVHFTNFVTPLRKAGRLPWIVTIHDLAVWRVPEAFPRGYTAYLRTAIEWSARHADKVVTVSQAVKWEITETLGLPERKIAVIPNAVDPIFLYTPKLYPEKRQSLRYRLGFPQESYLLLYVGALERRKNLSVLFQALESLWRKGLPVALLLVGKVGHGFAYPPPSPFWRHLGSPNDEELVRLYDLADALVLPSLYEGFGFPVVEALARGLLPILSDTPVFREVAGPFGVYFPSEDAQALEERILEAMNTKNTREPLYNLASLRPEWVQRFHPERILWAYKALYEGVVW